MKIALIGASGNIGSRILNEALARGHQVTAIAREPEKVTFHHPNLKVEAGDIMKPTALVRTLIGHDLIISAISPGHDKPEHLTGQTKNLIDAAKSAKINRVIAVGGAGGLYAAPGVKVINTPQFPMEWKGIAQAHIDALDIYLAENDLSWTNVSPSAFIEPGLRSGVFRTGENNLLTDRNGNSKISMEDFAVAIIDEAEQPQFIRKRFTVGY